MKRRTLGVAGLLLLVVTLPYLFTLNHPFIYDDHGQILENPFLINPDNLSRVLTLDTLDEDKIINGRRPLVLQTYFIDRAIWKTSPAGFRLTNLFWHAMALCGFGWLVYRLTGKRILTLASFALFGAHPVLIEAVHVPAFRPDLMYTAWVLVYLHLALIFRKGNAWMLAGMAVAQFLALASKETGVIAPALLLGMWWCFPETRLPKKRSLAALAAGAVPILLYAALCAGGTSFQATSGSWNGISYRPPENFFSAPFLWAHYLGLMILPAGLSVDRIVPAVTGVLTGRFLLGVFALAGAVWLLWRRRPGSRGFGIVLMLLVFLPVSNLVPLFNPVAERYAYFMAAGWGLFVARALMDLYPRRGAIVIGVTVASLLASCSIRLYDFRSDEALWQKTLRTHPRSARAHTWLGIGLQEKQQFHEALKYFEEAARLNPQEVSAVINSGIIYGRLGDLKKAEASFRKAIEHKPKSPDAHWNLAVTLMQLGDMPGCMAEVEETLIHAPMKMEALKAKLTVEAQSGQWDQAGETAERILKIDPDDSKALQVRTYLKGNSPGRP